MNASKRGNVIATIAVLLAVLLPIYGFCGWVVSR